MFRPVLLDDALELFHPGTGQRVRLDTPATRGLRQRAPRSVQFSLTNACNLSCGFCSRPTERASTWTVDTALALLADLDRRGVVEVAFGGGEPLAFRGLFDLVDGLVQATSLAVHLTTNGVLLTDAALDRLKGKVGEIRLSLYDDNDWRRTVTRLVQHGVRFGVNQLVTPDLVAELPTRVDELVALGCRDVLLLPALGHPELALSTYEARWLAAWLEHPPTGVTIKLGVCWGPELAHLPRLFASSDCGAGADFVEITSDRHVRPCSFHAVAVPFQTADDVIALWRAHAPTLRSHAGCVGCPRGRLPQATPEAPPTVRIYEAFASNNSGSYTLLGRFTTDARAAEVASLLNQVVVDMQAHPDGPNPLQALLASAGIRAPANVGRYGDWPDDWSEPPQAVALGVSVWWHAEYTITLPDEIGHWFYAMGGKVVAEIDHAHHGLIAHLTFFADMDWKERSQRPLEPLIPVLRTGPLSTSCTDFRLRQGEWHILEALAFRPTPDGLRAVVAHARELGLTTRVHLTEALTDAPDLDKLWTSG